MFMFLLLILGSAEVAAQERRGGNLHYPNGTIYVGGHASGSGPEVRVPNGQGDYDTIDCTTNEKACREALLEADNDAKKKERKRRRTQTASLPPGLQKEVEEYETQLKIKYGVWRKHNGTWSLDD